MIGQNTSWNWLAGEETGRAGTPQMQWANMPESWGVFVLVAIIAAFVFCVFWLYKRELSTCPMPVKWLLASLRLAVLLLLVAMLLKPSMFYQQVNEIKPNINLVRDSSLSFARGDKYQDDQWTQKLAKELGFESSDITSGNVTRAQLLNKALADKDWVQSVREKGSLQIIDFFRWNGANRSHPCNRQIRCRRKRTE